MKILNWTKQYFADKGVENPRLDAEVLLCAVLKCERINLYVDFERPLTENELAQFKQYVVRRAKHEPLAYILGEKAFMRNMFKVTPDTLVPRPETELLVESLVMAAEAVGGDVKILDIGTGSGAIIVSLLDYLPQAKGVGVDISVGALTVAKENAVAIGVAERAGFLRSDVFSALPLDKKFDIIVSNPPYIPAADIAGLAKDVQKEPLGALDLKLRQEMQYELIRLKKELGITFLYVTHDQEEALTLSDTIVVMNEGKIQQIGTPTDIYNEPCNAFVADFIGESNILNATMVRDRLVRFMDKEFECIDEGFGENAEVDVVIRPEDVYIIRNAEAAMFTGTVRSCIFKGVHYEMFVDTPDGYEIQIQDYNSFEPGTEVGMMIKPADIHVMRKERTENHIEGRLIDSTHVEILGESFECAEVEGIENGAKVDVAFDFSAVELTDDPDDGISWGTIRFILYKGDRYHLTVRTDDGDDVYVDTHDVWEDLDEVGITIHPSALRVTAIKE